MKLNKILIINNILENIISNDTDCKIDVAFKFNILTILKDLSSYIENYNKIKNDNIQKLGQVDENGMYTIDIKNNPDNAKKFIEIMTQLEQTDIDYNSSIKLDKEHIFNIGLSPKELVELYELIE